MNQVCAISTALRTPGGAFKKKGLKSGYRHTAVQLQRLEVERTVQELTSKPSELSLECLFRAETKVYFVPYFPDMPAKPWRRKPLMHVIYHC